MLFISTRFSNLYTAVDEVRDEKNAGVGVFSRGYWLDDDLTPGYSRRAV